MTIYQLKQLLEQYPNEAEVVLSMKPYGTPFEADLDYWRVDYKEDKLVIDAEDD